MITLLALLAVAVPDTTVTLPRGGTVSIETMSHNIRLDVGSGDQVRVVGASAHLHGNRLSIESEFPGSGTGVVQVTVPAWASVGIESALGTVEVTAAPTHLEIETMSGAVTVVGGRGTLRVSTAAGQITIRDFTGTRLEAESMAGPVLIAGATGEVRVETVGGLVQLHRVTARNVAVETVAGDIDWQGSLGARSYYRFESHGGAVILRLPASVSARLRISTFSGAFRTAHPARTTSRTDEDDEDAGERQITAILGGGAADVDVETFSGDIQVLELGAGPARRP